MSADLTVGLVRILRTDGTTTGTGFVISDEGLIATCSHVVQSEESQGRGDPRPDTVDIVFQATGERRQARVEPEWWRPADAEDVAILRMEDPLPEGVKPLPLGSSAASRGHEFNSRGYRLAEHFPEGLEAGGKIQGHTSYKGQTALQLLTNQIDQGMSGAPILDLKTRGVVGMVNFFWETERHVDAWLAFATPIETLRQVCPDLRLSDICPYRGLAAFTEADAELFFGREALVAQLVAHLRRNPRFLAVVGPSGSGKSSVVQAGLFPALRRGEMPDSETWHVLAFRPGADPWSALSSVGLDATPGGDLQAAVRSYLERHPEVGRLVLFADQFEELFALCPERVQERFMRELLTLLESDLPITVILTLRADFYGYLLRDAPLVEWLKMSQVNVPPMGSEELKAAIEKPTEGVGLRFEPGLVEVIVEDACEVEHALPLLESALTQLWGQRKEGVLTHAAYQEIGQVTGAIGLWAEDTYSQLSEEQKRLARQVFTRLVHYGEEELTDTRQRCTLASLVARPEEREVVHRLVQKMANTRLLVTDRDPETGEETTEIIHDALLREWARLRRWLTEQREFYLWRQRLVERLQDWEENGRDKDLLLRGPSLAEAERWLTQRPDNLNQVDQAYIQQSIALRDEEQATREQRRRRAILSLGVGIIVTAILALLAWWQRGVAIDQTNVAETARADLEAQRNEALHQASIAETAQANEALRRSEAEAAEATSEARRQEALARQLAAQAEILRTQKPGLSTRSILLAIESLRRSPSLEADHTLRRALAVIPRLVARVAHSDQVYAIAFSQNSKRLATISLDGTTSVWDSDSDQEVISITHGSSIPIGAFSQDGKWLVVVGVDGSIHVFETVTGQRISFMKNEDRVQAVAFSPDGTLLATGSLDGITRVWKTTSGQLVAEMKHESRVQVVAFSPNGKLLAIGSGDPSITGSGEVRLWEATTGKEVINLDNRERVTHAVFNPSGSLLATSSTSDVFDVRVWEVASGQEVTQVRHEGTVLTIAFGPDGRWLVTGGVVGARLWTPTTGKKGSEINHLEGELVNAVAFSPNGRWLVTAGSDHVARVWHIGTYVDVLRMAPNDYAAQIAHEDEVYTVAFSPDGRLLATAGKDGTAQIWEIADAQDISRIEPWRAVSSVAFSRDGQWLATANLDLVPKAWEEKTGTASVWAMTTGEELVRVPHGKNLQAVALSPDGRWLATAGDDDTGRMWEVSTGREVAQIRHDSQVEDVVFSPDGRWLATASLDHTAKIIEVATRQEVATLEHEDRVYAADFSPDGALLATGGRDYAAWVWEVQTGQLATFIPHNDRVHDVAFSPNGKWLATATGLEDHAARIWEVETGRELVSMVHEDRVWSLAFSPDGRWLATGSDDKMVRLWEVATGQEVKRIERADIVRSVVFSPDGRWLVTNSDGRIMVNRPIWPSLEFNFLTLSTDDLIIDACSRLSRNLTVEEWEQYLPGESYHRTCPNLPLPESPTTR